MGQNCPDTNAKLGGKIFEGVKPVAILAVDKGSHSSAAHEHKNRAPNNLPLEDMRL